MLKKAGILVAATAAGLLAVSPLAFAGDKDHDGGYEGGNHHTSSHYEQGDVDIDIDDRSVNNDVDIEDSSVNNCDNEQSSNDESVNGGGLLLGAVSVLNSSNANVLQCANILNNFLNENDVAVDVL